MQGVGSRMEKPLQALCGVFHKRFCVRLLIKPKEHQFEKTVVRSIKTVRTPFCVSNCHNNHLSYKSGSYCPGQTSVLGCYHDNHIQTLEPVTQLSGQIVKLYSGCCCIGPHRPSPQSSGHTVEPFLDYSHYNSMLLPKPTPKTSEQPTGPCLECYHDSDMQSYKPTAHYSGQRLRQFHVPSVGNHFGHHSGLLSTCVDHSTHSFSQKRNFSAETYYKYFSPDFPPIGFAQKVFEYVHDVTGLPWWASILFTTFTLRTVITLPLAVHAMKVIAKVEMLQPEIKDLSTELKKEVALAVKKFGWQQPRARKMYNATMKKLIRDLYVRDNCHPMKASVLALVQLPMWFSLSFALRNMSGAVPVAGLALPVLCPGLLTEGTLWFTNLTVPDALWILPISMGVFNLMNIELHALERSRVNRLQMIITNVMRVISVMMIGIGALVPTSMSLYWSFSSFYGVLQTLAFKSPRVKRILRIPKTPRESDTPYEDLWQRAKNKYSWRKRDGK